jgi:hypothetical protein
VAAAFAAAIAIASFGETRLLDEARDCASMNSASRSSTTDDNRQLAGAACWPVLARLPDVSIDSSTVRPTKQARPGAIEYRFDPPQLTDSALKTSTSSQTAIRNPRSAIPRQPHVFERGRTVGQRGIPRRESPILPRSNPFSIPRKRLIDSVAPAIRFLTMVALFTAAGIWIQMMGRRTSLPDRPTETPRTADQPAVAPANNPLDHHLTPAPTAAGPIESSPKTGARVGRADGDDFANRERPAVAMPLAIRPTSTPPHFLVSSGGPWPRVQTTDPKPAGVGDAPAHDEISEQNRESDDSPTVAQRPGFLIEIPTR